MTEVRMEVVDEREAREYCKVHGLEFVTCYIYDNNLMMLATSPTTEESDEELDYLEKQYNKNVLDSVIFYVNDKGNRLYLGKNNLVNNIADAKKFSYDAARAKAVQMRKVGNHDWKLFRLKE